MGRELFKLGDVIAAEVVVRDEADGIGDEMESAGPDHPDVAHGVADVSDEDSELVHVGGDAIGHDAQLSNGLVEFPCSVEGIILQLLRRRHSLTLVQIQLAFPEEPQIFGQSGFDVLIVEKLGEDDKLFPEELVREIYLCDAALIGQATKKKKEEELFST